MLSDPPVRLCCGQAHWGVVCPDDTVMCCICWARVPVDCVWRDSNGNGWDMCEKCGEENGVPS